MPTRQSEKFIVLLLARRTRYLSLVIDAVSLGIGRISLRNRSTSVVNECAFASSLPVSGCRNLSTCIDCTCDGAIAGLTEVLKGAPEAHQPSARLPCRFHSTR